MRSAKTSVANGIGHGAAGKIPRLVEAIKRFKDTAGAAAIEAAFVLPLFFAGVLAITEFGRVMFAKVEFEHAIYDAARVGMLANGASVDQIKAAVGQRFVTLDPARISTLDVAEVVNADNSTTATLRASYEFDFLIKLAGVPTVTLDYETAFLRPN